VTSAQFTWSARDGVAIVDTPHELDLNTADRLRICCQEAIDATGPRIVVNLADTVFMDSTALGVLVGIAKRTSAEGGWLRLVTGASAQVQKILKITALDAILGNYSSVEVALQA